MYKVGKEEVGADRQMKVSKRVGRHVSGKKWELEVLFGHLFCATLLCRFQLLPTTVFVKREHPNFAGEESEILSYQEITF